MSRVSVVIPTYNRPELLRRAIRSVLDQTLSDFELIVVDDGSADATAHAVQGFADPRIVYLRQGRDGRSAARNRGIEAARGEMISFLDDDDRYLPDKLKLQYDFLTARPDLDGVASGTRLLDDSGRVLLTSEPWDKGAPLDLADWLIMNRFCPWATMVRRTTFQGWEPWFDPELDYAEDAAFYIRLAQRGARMDWLRAPVYEYWLHRERTGREVAAYQINLQKVTERVLNDPDTPLEVVSRRQGIRAERDLRAALRLCHAGATPLAATWLSQAMSEDSELFAGACPSAVDIIGRYVSEQVLEHRSAFLNEWADCLPDEASGMREGIARLRDAWTEPVRHYRAFGLQIDSELELGENESEPEEADLRVLSKRPAASDSENAGTQLEMVSVADWESFSLFDGRVISVDPTMVSFLMEKLIPLALIQRGALVFHAVVVALGGAAVALLGPPRIGKTTLALALVRDAGARILDDDILAVWPRRHGMIVEPGWGMIKLWPETARRFGLDPETLERQYHGTDKLVWRGAPIQGEPLPITTLFIIEQSDASRVNRLEPGQVVEALERHWYGSLYEELFNAAGGAPNRRRQSERLARSVETWRLTLDLRTQAPLSTIVWLIAEALNHTMEIK